MKSFMRLTYPLLCAALVACGDGNDHNRSTESHDASARDASTSTNDIETAGTWKSNFATTEVITNERWDLAKLVTFDNATNVAITQTATDAQWFPGTFNRLVWTEIEDDLFHYCIIAYGLDSRMRAATSTIVPDATNPDVSGCGMFPWTELTRVTS